MQFSQQNVWIEISRLHNAWPDGRGVRLLLRHLPRPLHCPRSHAGSLLVQNLSKVSTDWAKSRQLCCSCCVTVSCCSGLWGVLWPTRCSCLIGSWLPRKPLPLDLSLRWVIENSLVDQTFWINLKMTRRCCLWIIKDFFGRPTILNIFENDPRCCLRTICIQRLPLVSPNMPHCQVQRSNTARWQEFKSKSFVIGKKLPCWSGSSKRWGREIRAETAEQDGEQQADGEMALRRGLPAGAELSLKKEKVTFPFSNPFSKGFRWMECTNSHEKVFPLFWFHLGRGSGASVGNNGLAAHL